LLAFFIIAIALSLNDYLTKPFYLSTGQILIDLLIVYSALIFLFLVAYVFSYYTKINFIPLFGLNILMVFCFISNMEVLSISF